VVATKKEIKAKYESCHKRFDHCPTSFNAELKFIRESAGGLPIRSFA